jgi:predicted small secreted protein
MTRVLLILTVSLSLAGCETIRGLGRDLNNVGDALLGN